MEHELVVNYEEKIRELFATLDDFQKIEYAEQVYLYVKELFRP